jgi:beta-phosphoglucomutase-like phosphatase (HAD superfamily)
VLNEVFRVIREEAAGWPLPQERRDFLLERFRHPDRVYDARITASDSSEIRLKPHRDLYAIALHALGVLPEAFHRVIGFEDSESGTIAIRAAGISLCCALPFAMTKDHEFGAATQVCRGGMPEVILEKSFFLAKLP